MKDDFENISISQLQWACRRGMLELDVLLGNFLNEAYSGLEKADKQSFIELLSCSDPVLFTWLMGHEEPAERFTQIIEMIRRHARSRI